MSTTYCDIDYHEDITSSLPFNEKRSVAAALAFSLAFSGGLAYLAVEVLLRLQS